MLLGLVFVAIVLITEIHDVCCYQKFLRCRFNQLKSLIHKSDGNKDTLFTLFNNMEASSDSHSIDRDQDDDTNAKSSSYNYNKDTGSSRYQQQYFHVDTTIPGHVNNVPYSLNEKTRLQYASMVVSAAIVLLTLKVKYEKWIEKWNELNTMNNKSMNDQFMNNAFDDSKIVKLDNGIIYEDIDLGDGIDLEYGGQYNLSIKVFYNGILVNNYIDIAFIYGVKNTIFDKLSLSGLNESGIFDGMKAKIISNNNSINNSKRSVILPSNYAYGPKGFSPYVPPMAVVKVELSIV